MSKKPAKLEYDASPGDLRRILGTAPPGAWVALSQDKTRIVGTGLSAQAATYQAQLRGEASPVLVKMPVEDEGIAAGAT